MLPTPLQSSQQGSGQRAPAILRFDTPRISADVFSTLQNAALLSASRTVVVGEERSRLELELRQRIQVTETPGRPGSPGTPARTDTVTLTESHLDARALTDLQSLLDRFDRNGGDSRLVRALAEDLQQFSRTIGDGRGDDVLGQIVGRIERSVIGEGGLDFADLFRDPTLFLSIAAGLTRFADETGSQAASALRDVILRIGDKRFSDSNPNNDSVRSIGAAIDRLGRALDDEPGAVAALERFLDRLPGPSQGGRYAQRIADILDETLGDLQAGSLDGAAIARIQTAIQDIRTLENIPGRRDNRLRDRAIEGLEDILDRHASETTRSQTVTTPGEPAVAGTPAERSVTILQETALVPKVETVQRVITIYESVQAAVEPLRKLSQPPPPVPSLQALVSAPPQSGVKDAEGGSRFVIRARDDEDDTPPFGIPRADGDDGFGGSPVLGPGSSLPAASLGRNPGSLVDSRI